MAVALTVENRPTEPGLYFLAHPLPGKISLPDAKRKLEGKLTLPVNTDQIVAGMLVYDEGGIEKPVTLAGAQAAYMTGTTLSGARWTQQVALIGANGIVSQIGFYVLLLDEMPPAPGLVDVVKTEFDENGNIVAEYDSFGNKWTPNTVLDGYDELGAVFLAPVLWAALISIGAFLIKALIVIGIVAATAAIFFPASKLGKNHAMGIFDGLKYSILAMRKWLGETSKNVWDSIKTGAKWAFAALALYTTAKVFDVFD